MYKYNPESVLLRDCVGSLSHTFSLILSRTFPLTFSPSPLLYFISSHVLLRLISLSLSLSLPLSLSRMKIHPLQMPVVSVHLKPSCFYVGAMPLLSTCVTRCVHLSRSLSHSSPSFLSLSHLLSPFLSSSLPLTLSTSLSTSLYLSTSLSLSLSTGWHLPDPQSCFKGRC